MAKAKIKDDAQTEAAQVDVQEDTGSKNLPAVAASAPPPPANVARPSEPAAQGSLPVTPFGNLATSIAKIMVGIAEQRVEKKGENTFHHYKYATMQDILQKLTPLIAAEGIVIMQSEVGRSFIDDGNAVQVVYEFTVMHKSGEVWPQKVIQTGVCNSRANNGKFDDKAVNKCHTSARKYFLLALFQIPTEDETDPDRGDNDSAPRKQYNKPTTGRQTTTKPEAKPPEEIVKMLTPVAIDTKNSDGAFKKFAVWAGEFVAQLNFADTPEAFEQWVDLNSETLEQIRTNANGAKIAANIDNVISDRREELNAGR